MSGWPEALLTYGLTIVIAFGIAGMIHLMVAGKISPQKG